MSDTKKLLKKRILSNVIDFYSIFLVAPIIYGFFLTESSVLIFLIIVILIHRYSGYTLGNYIVGTRTIFRKNIGFFDTVFRAIKAFFINFFLLNLLLIITVDFKFNSCGQFEYDKKYDTYTIDKTSKNNSLEECKEETFCKFFDHLIWFGLYNITAFFILFVVAFVLEKFVAK